jgi:hypothetical protein
VLRSDVRVYFVGDNLFALRVTGYAMCSYAGRIVRENRGRGIQICESQPRGGFVVRFRAPQDRRPLRELPPDDDLLNEEQRQQPSRRFEFRGIDELFGR